MCGIAGIAGRMDGRDAALTRMLRDLAHRGPDGEGRIADGDAAFGHRRLSIIDLEGGRQPLINADGSLWLVCNGEIYNYQGIREQFVREGYAFQTHSDCEVILALYEKYGDGLLDHLRGMFAFALWDTRKRRLLIARDHLGQKPMFYAWDGRRLGFGSEIKALLGMDPALRRLNLQAMDQYLALRLIAPPLTMFRGVHKLPPGHKLVLEWEDSPCVERYWNLSFEPKRVASESQILDELQALLTETLKLHMVSDVPVGAFLSGGMDSSLIVAMLAREVGVRDLPTFTVALPYREFSEAPHAAAVARRFGTQHHEQTLDGHLLRFLPDVVWHLDEPSDSLALCSYVLARMTQKHVKVVLGGDGGDELFGGYDRYYGNLAAGRYARVPRLLRRALDPLVRALPESGWYKSPGHKLRWLHQLSYLPAARRYSASLSYFHFENSARAALLTDSARAELTNWRGEAAIEAAYDDGAGSSLDRMLRADSRIRLPDHPVMISDRTTMAVGLEARSPFMDHKLVEFCARLPDGLKIHGRSLRYLQRRLAERYLDKEILDRPKQGFASALPYLLKNDLARLYDRSLTRSELAAAGLLRQAGIDAIVQAHQQGGRDHGTRLWLLANLEIWYRMAILGHPREQIAEDLNFTSTAQAA
jgi:asparagine synthase (glutamine-hydrolysing)